MSTHLSPSAARPIDLLSRALRATRDGRTLHLTERMLLLQVQRDGEEPAYLPLVDEKQHQARLKKKLRHLENYHQSGGTRRRRRRLSPHKRERLKVIQHTSPYQNPKKLLAKALSDVRFYDRQDPSPSVSPVAGTDYTALLARQQALIDEHGVGLWDRIVGSREGRQGHAGSSSQFGNYDQALREEHVQRQRRALQIKRLAQAVANDGKSESAGYEGYGGYGGGGVDDDEGALQDGMQSIQSIQQRAHRRGLELRKNMSEDLSLERHRLERRRPQTEQQQSSPQHKYNARPYTMANGERYGCLSLDLLCATCFFSTPIFQYCFFH
jgi:hypothetical protein